MTTNDKISTTSTTTDTQETAMNTHQTENSVPQPETESIVTSGNVIGDDITYSDDAEGMSADAIEAALTGKQSYMDAASACEQAARDVYLTDGRVASGEAEVRRLIYLALARAYAFYLAYCGTPDYDNYIRSRGVDPAPKQSSKFGPLLKAVFGLGKKATIKLTEAEKGRMRKRISMMASALELAELRAKADANGNIDIVAFLEGKVDAEGHSGLEAARAEMSSIRSAKTCKDIVSAKFKTGLDKLLANASSVPPTIGSAPVLLAVHAVDGELAFLGQVTGDSAEKLLTQFIEQCGDEEDPLSGTAMGELVGHLSFARGLGAVDCMVRIDVTDTGVQVRAALASTETVIGQCFIAGPSYLSPGTYWLDKAAVAKITSISRFAKHGAVFEVHPSLAQNKKTHVSVFASGIQTAVNSYNDVGREKNPSEYKEINLGNIVDIEEYQKALVTDQVQMPCALQMPTIAEISYPEDWQWSAETVIDEATRKWVTKTMNTTGKGEIAKAVRAGTDRNLANVRVTNDGFHVLDGLREGTVASQRFHAPIDGDAFQATYCFRSKDLPGALSAIKGVLPDAPVNMFIAEKAILLRAEQDGTVAEFLIPTLIEGTRYPKAAKLTGFVTEDEPQHEQDAA